MSFRNLNPNDAEYIITSKRGPCDVALSYNPFKRYQAWRFLTYMFVHKGYVLNLNYQKLISYNLYYYSPGYITFLVI